MDNNLVKNDAAECLEMAHQCLIEASRTLARLHQLRGLGDAKVLKSLGHSPKGRHYRG